MKTKIFYGNQYVGKFNCTGAKITFMQHVAIKVKRILLIAGAIQAIIWSGYGLVQYGKANAPVVVQAQVQTVEVPVLNSPVLEKIAKCESGNSQFDKTGQVLIRVNTNGTVDIGKYQINSVWKATATKLGLDLTKEKDNESFAQWLYLNKGTGDWSASAKCWNR